MAVNVGKNIDIFKSRVSFLPIWDWGFVTISEKSKLFYQFIVLNTTKRTTVDGLSVCSDKILSLLNTMFSFGNNQICYYMYIKINLAVQKCPWCRVGACECDCDKCGVTGCHECVSSCNDEHYNLCNDCAEE